MAYIYSTLDNLNMMRYKLDEHIKANNLIEDRHMTRQVYDLFTDNFNRYDGKDESTKFNLVRLASILAGRFQNAGSTNPEAASIAEGLFLNILIKLAHS